MTERSLIMLAVVLATALAQPARAEDPATQQGVGAGIALHDLGPLAAGLPSDPVLRGVEGASDGGTSRIFYGALWGGLAGAVVGLGVALIENGNWGRDIGIGAGAGIIVGAALGAAGVFGDTRAPYADGLGSPDRDPVIQGRTVALAARF